MEKDVYGCLKKMLMTRIFEDQETADRVPLQSIFPDWAVAQINK
ncbi:hypothetical protein NBRC111894_1757 [Sporolactobacillus inulinus]|uniref:Uncharacterized protein n=1 Tax=Sporolactobacillus inulinus TaxID=2078 RepID=A0A4Y1ZB99_9BACL|nr:hypothetical protein NBRC111894_1757 [Sporolactobacillus inulinus]